ncbi:sulfatase family protein [Runella salmonicolor]|uniref:Arylsulfatase n=1 Tax=Runella salmonicolor TaxID=2950278 RepID=A0ABT1FIQ6_9BACT|nr:arylsulfatase [Runella salmonicolor]MCP1381652.1 arylsulfatase [Runella salmonicolor]
MNPLKKLSLLIAFVAFSIQITKAQATLQKPNIILIYVDDLGYGDIGVNGAVGVKTPNIDFLAKNGVNFSDAHCSASTCTPSRYSLLTGSHAFRSQAAILQGDAPLLINPKQGSLASMLKKAGYATGVVGKWHLGLGNGTLDWNQEISPGPREIGFDYSFLIPATGDRVPCVFVENQKVVGLDPNDPMKVSYGERIEGGYPIGTENPDLLRVDADTQHKNAVINGVSRIGFMSGGKKALWTDEDFPFVLTQKATSFIEKNKTKPFFLFYAYHDIHVPRLPHQKFQGKSSMGARGDVIAQMDWCTGEIMKKLKAEGLDKNTMIIFTSDNGPILQDGYADKAAEMVGNHKPAGIYTGTKYSIYEGGNRVPTIVYWNGTVKPKKSAALLSQIDLYASLAAFLKQEIPAGDAPDSQNFMDSWLGKSNKGREYLLEEGFTYALRKGDWKYIKPTKSNGADWMKNKQIDSGHRIEKRLFNLKTDIKETKNLAAEHPDILKELEQKLNDIITSKIQH